MLKRDIVKLSKQLGFDLIGFCNPEVEESAKSTIKSWISHSYHADMKYMKDTIDIRADPKKLLPDVKTVIVFGLSYGRNYKIKVGKNKIYEVIITLSRVPGISTLATA